MAFRASVEDDLEIPDVVVIVVGDEDPAHEGGVDHRERLLEPGVAHERAAGVDDDRFAAADHEAVGAEVAPGRAGGERRDEPRVGGDRLGPSRENGELHARTFHSLVVIRWD